MLGAKSKPHTHLKATKLYQNSYFRKTSIIEKILEY